jgi:hypothetical protein
MCGEEGLSQSSGTAFGVLYFRRAAGGLCFAETSGYSLSTLRVEAMPRVLGP